MSSANEATDATDSDIHPKSQNPPPSDKTPNSTQQSPPDPTEPKKKKRPICPTCNFPPRTCVCPALPPEPLSTLFQKCRLVVLQHPHEMRRKNRSLPLVELCMFGKCGSTGEVQANNSNGQNNKRTVESNDSQQVTFSQNDDIESTHEHERNDDVPSSSTEKSPNENEKDDFVMKTIQGRRFGNHCDASVMNILRDPSEVVVLVFPHPDALDLEEGIALAEKRCGYVSESNNDGQNSNGKLVEEKCSDSHALNDQKQKKKMTIIFLDATWKHAREMENKTTTAGVWPENMIRVQLAPSVSKNVNDEENEGDESTKINSKVTPNEVSIPGAETTSTNNTESRISSPFIQRRFQIRAPPSPDHLSTAECLAWIASRVEGKPEIFESVMKALDYMVQIWKDCAVSDDSRHKHGKRFTDGDGFMSSKGGGKDGWSFMSQKKRKIRQIK